MHTRLCIIRLDEGERVEDALGAVLDTPDMTTMGPFTVSKEHPTELHYHDYDEYWYFTEGTTTVTLRTADGQCESYRVGTGDLVVTPKGVEHGHIPDDVVKGVQWVSVIHPEARREHLHREFASIDSRG